MQFDSSSREPESLFSAHKLLRARDWQDRPEFSALIDWWKCNATGVCSLIGMGGAGKTATIDRFLLALPGGYLEQPRVPKLNELNAPDGTFIYSFYDAPSAESFFLELTRWLRGEESRSINYRDLISALKKFKRCLIVLDGLERVQEDALRGIFGRISDGHLRRFILSVADGDLPNLSIIVTSRFRLHDPIAERSWYHQELAINTLPEYAAIQLLRDRGVSGTSATLRRLARDYGLHALTVDLVGGFIARFMDGDSSRIESISDLDLSSLDEQLRPADRNIAKQERRLAQITEYYRSAIARDDPAMLALLERVCLLRHGVDAATLTKIFTGPGKELVSGPKLAQSAPHEVDRKLAILVEMKLLERQIGSHEREPTFVAHPAIRDGFVSRLDADVVRRGHQAVKVQLEASLGKRPAADPSDPAMLDLLEEIVYHALSANQRSAAVQVYQSRMGGCHNLIAGLCDYSRASRIATAILSTNLAPPLPPSTEATLCNDVVLSRIQLGQLQEAENYALRGLSLGKHIGKSTRHLLRHRLAEIQWLSGRLTQCRVTIREILIENDGVNCTKGSVTNLSELARMQGEVVSTLDSLDVESLLPANIYRELSDADLEFDHIRPLEHVISEALCHKANEEKKHPKGHRDIANCEIYLAECFRRAGDLSKARGHLNSGCSWAIEHDSDNLLCDAMLAEAKIELSEAAEAKDTDSHDQHIDNATHAVRKGLQIAAQCGFGLTHINLLLLRARIALYQGNPESALKDVQIALDNGMPADKNSGQPEMLAATAPDCCNVWAILEGRQIRAEAILLQAAQNLGVSKISDWTGKIPAKNLTEIEGAKRELADVLRMYESLGIAQAGSATHHDELELKSLLFSIDHGIITKYPLAQRTPAAIPYSQPAEELSTTEASNSPSQQNVYNQYFMSLIGSNFMGDNYHAGQAGAMGPNASAQNMTFQQIWTQNAPQINLAELNSELDLLLDKLRERASTPEQDMAIGAVTAAQRASQAGDGPKALEFLKGAGAWVVETAKEIGTKVVSQAIQSAMGIPPG